MKYTLSIEVCWEFVSKMRPVSYKNYKEIKKYVFFQEEVRKKAFPYQKYKSFSHSILVEKICAIELQSLSFLSNTFSFSFQSGCECEHPAVGEQNDLPLEGTTPAYDAC